MVMADVLTVVFVIVALMLSGSAFFLFCRAMLPRVVHQAHKRFAFTPIRTFPVGFFLGGLGLIPTLILLNIPFGPVRVIGVWAVATLFAVALLGLAGLAAHVGRSMASPNDAGREWVQLVKGGLAIELMFLVPILGWFLLLPAALICGIGATALAVVLPLRRELDEPVAERAGTVIAA